MLLGLRAMLQAYRPYSAVPPEGGAAPAADARPSSAGRPIENGLPTAGVLGELAGALDSARTGISNFLDLVSFEARRAALGLIWMVVLAIVAAICIVSAWLGLMAALAIWAVSLGVLPVVAVIGVTLLNCIAGALLFRASIGRGHDLLFSATRRQVAGACPVRPPAP